MVRALAGLPFAADGTADSRRTAWAGVGVYLDDLSSLVLCLGLPGDTRTALGSMLASCREAGQPAVLALRMLRCHDGPLLADRVRTCENPVVVAAAADEFGPQCCPLVCVNGQPSAAGRKLLELLAAGEATFDYHGDFDWGGIRIAGTVRNWVNWRPWRYDRLLPALQRRTGLGRVLPVPGPDDQEPGRLPASSEISAATSCPAFAYRVSLVMLAVSAGGPPVSRGHRSGLRYSWTETACA